MEIEIWTIISVVINGINVFLIGITAWIIHKQIEKNTDWNIKKTSQEILNHLTTGEYLIIKSELQDKFGCDFSDECQNYLELKNKDEVDKNYKFDRKLAQFFNIFEVISINMKNGIVREDICKNYLHLMFTAYYRWGFSFIDQERKRCKNKEIFLEFENYAKKWSLEKT